jgi:hypothetical protein
MCRVPDAAWHALRDVLSTLRPQAPSAEHSTPDSNQSGHEIKEGRGPAVDFQHQIATWKRLLKLGTTRGAPQTGRRRLRVCKRTHKVASVVSERGFEGPVPSFTELRQSGHDHLPQLKAGSTVHPLSPQGASKVEYLH